ncbi:MAG TPA: hypothetical protein VE646_13185 [Actinomycetota bacterium]|nr:hypothetical protein [Actinomycetota bacterium]
MARVIRSRSALVLGALVLVLALVAGLGAVQAEPRPDLPPVGPKRLIASTLEAIAQRGPVSGEVHTHVDLGLPQLPGNLAGPSGPADVLLSDQTFRVWRSADGVRVAQVLPFGERDAVGNATDAWFWDSQRFTAWHASVPAQAGSSPQIPSLGDLTDLVGTTLRRLQPYAEVRVTDPVMVAGRSAYVLRLVPSSGDTLIGHVDVAVDARTRVPLRISVVAAGGSAPVIEAGFTSVSFGPIDPQMFSFSPPQGATVKQVRPHTGMEPAAPEHGASSGDLPAGVRVFGRGFGTVLAIRVDTVPQDLGPLFPYAGPLGSADVVERGDHAWIVAGAVPPGRLAEVEPTLP